MFPFNPAKGLVMYRQEEKVKEFLSNLFVWEAEDGKSFGRAKEDRRRG